MKVKDFIGKKVRFDDFGGGYFWGKQKDGSEQMIAEVRGWGAIQHLFDTEEEAEKFQDDIGRFIAEAINEKLSKQ